MNKMNKKGFTLIEMLVVIAIIAILVSIIVPVVGDATTKAAAATNAANLRSAAASIAIEYMSEDVEVADTITTGKGYEITDYSIVPPAAKTNGSCEGGDFAAYLTANGAIECYYGDHDITYYANLAS